MHDGLELKSRMTALELSGKLITGDFASMPKITRSEFIQAFSTFSVL